MRPGAKNKRADAMNSNAWAIFPSGNSEAAQACADAWWEAGWLVGVLIDADQPDVQCDRLFREPNYRGTGASFNKMLLELDYEFAACVNDDMFPVNCRPETVREVYQKHFGSVRGIIQPTGAWFDAMAWCAPCPIIARSYGPNPWNEAYYHLGVDCELKDVAELRDLYLATTELAIEHRHKSLGFTDTLPTEKRAKNNAMHAADLKLYEQRKAAGFP